MNNTCFPSTLHKKKADRMISAKTFGKYSSLFPILLNVLMQKSSLPKATQIITEKVQANLASTNNNENIMDIWCKQQGLQS